MYETVRSPLTPQQKLIAVNDQLGNSSMAKQQGSSVEIYDALPLSAAQTRYDFFLDSSTRKFPFTNVKGTLQPQESFILGSCYYTLVTVDDVTAEVLTVERLDLATHPGFASGEMDFFIENQRILKQVPFRSFFPEFNLNSDNENESVYVFKTMQTLPPLLQFKMSVKFPDGFFTPVIGQTTYLYCSLAGPGGLFNPKANY